jgi:hypothetical protein
MNPKIAEHHRSRSAYVYLRQSTPGQVLHHQESTERQYALREKAEELGWSQASIRTLDGDLGKSGTQTAGREDFKTLVADVSMGQVGAVLALEASRLSRSDLDWHRLLELCALTQTLVIDEDGCYDPADFNDGLLLGLKGTMAQAELHFLRTRLHMSRRPSSPRRLRLRPILDAVGEVVGFGLEVRGVARRVEFVQLRASIIGAQPQSFVDEGRIDFEPAFRSMDAIEAFHVGAVGSVATSYDAGGELHCPGDILLHFIEAAVLIDDGGIGRDVVRLFAGQVAACVE